MKKISILSLCVLMGATAFGQTQVVKDAENAMKKGEYFEGVVKMITPAFTNPETAESAFTYYIPGKAGFNTFDEMIKMAALGQLPAGGEKLRSEALLGGYEYFMKAMPLDSLPDAKGKVKPKYSKDIVTTIGGHHADFSNAAIDFWNNEDWNGAYEAWDIYCNLPNDPRFVKSIPIIPNDTVIAEIMYNRSLAAFQSGDMEKTLKSFLQAKDKGYTKKALYDYAIAAAYNAGDEAAVEALCVEALPLYGSEDTRYISQLINNRLNDQKYAEALTMINKALETDPNNAQYYVIKGIICEQDGIDGNPKVEFEKAVEIDPYNTQALYNLGRTIYNEGVLLNDNAPTDPDEYSQAFRTQIVPVFKNAIDYLEQAWNVDNENRDALKLLEQAYYLIQDDKMLQDVQDRLAQ